MPLVQKGRKVIVGLLLEEKHFGKTCRNSNHTETLVRDFVHGTQMRNGGPKRLCLARGCSHSKPHPEIVKTAIK